MPGSNSREQPNTYAIQDVAKNEVLRLQLLDRTATVGMGGVLSEQPASLSLQRVLDVGCGTGGWLIALAQQHPEIPMLIGVDAHRPLIEYARSQAEAAGVSARVEFHIADALRMLEFPTDYFDLVNHRFAWSWLRTWDWPKLLQEYQRVARPDGIVRITEATTAIAPPSFPAYNVLARLVMEAMSASGQAFHEGMHASEAIFGALPSLLQKHELEDVQMRTYHIEHRADETGRIFFEINKLSFQNVLPFLRKWIRLPDDYDRCLQEMLQEIQRPDFILNWEVTTIWGHVSDRESSGYDHSH